jgi:hypothetical protein
MPEKRNVEASIRKRKEIKTDTQSITIAKKYAGAVLPCGAKIIGLFEQEKPYRRGAAIRLASGAIVQYNGGVLRSLPVIRNEKTVNL